MTPHPPSRLSARDAARLLSDRFADDAASQVRRYDGVVNVVFAVVVSVLGAMLLVHWLAGGA